MTKCSLCGEGPAAVFTPTMPLCRSCYRMVRDAEISDNAIANYQTCHVCAGELSPRGRCLACLAKRLVEGNRKMVRAG